MVALEYTKKKNVYFLVDLADSNLCVLLNIRSEYGIWLKLAFSAL